MKNVQYLSDEEEFEILKADAIRRCKTYIKEIDRFTYKSKNNKKNSDGLYRNFSFFSDLEKKIIKYYFIIFLGLLALFLILSPILHYEYDETMLQILSLYLGTFILYILIKLDVNFKRFLRSRPNASYSYEYDIKDRRRKLDKLMDEFELDESDLQ